MLLILINLVLLGVEVDVASTLPPGEEPPWFQTVNVIIVLIFVAEIVLKFVAHGCRDFFCGPDRWWNNFDLAIIAASVFETAMELIASAISVGSVDSSHLRIMRFVRLGRALRGVRVMRLLRFISALRSIVFAILSTLWSLVWTLVLLILLFYCFGAYDASTVSSPIRCPLPALLALCFCLHFGPGVILAQLVSDHCRFSALRAYGILAVLCSWETWDLGLCPSAFDLCAEVCLYLCVCMCVCMYVYIYIHIYIHTHIAQTCYTDRKTCLCV